MNIALTGLAKTRLFWKKHGALVMTCAGCASDIGSVVFATIAGTKLNAVMKKNNAEIQEARDSEDKKAVGKAYLRALGRMTKLYGPTVACMGVSIGTRIGSYKSLKANNIALAATASGIANKFAEYREKIKEKLGEEKENEIYKESEEELKKDPQKDVKTPYVLNDLSVPFTPANKSWEKDPGSCVGYLLTVQSYMNAKLQRCGTVFLSDVLKELQFEPEHLSKEMLMMSRVYGWTTGNLEKPAFVSFGISDEHGNLFPDTIEARNNGDLCYWLTFNCYDIVNDKNDFTKHIRTIL